MELLQSAGRRRTPNAGATHYRSGCVEPRDSVWSAVYSTAFLGKIRILRTDLFVVIYKVFLLVLGRMFFNKRGVNRKGSQESHLSKPETRCWRLPPGPSIGASTTPAQKDWPHAPVHRLSENAVYMVTTGTLYKKHLFNSDAKRDRLERMLLSMAKQHGWQLEAWAVLANHYHFVARGNPDSRNLGDFLQIFHYDSAKEVNATDHTPGRNVWHNYWDTRLTHQHSYLARLNYVHQNPVKHGLAIVANQYPWCSAAWFERTASPAQVTTIYRFKIDRLNIDDDF